MYLKLISVKQGLVKNNNNKKKQTMKYNTIIYQIEVDRLSLFSINLLTTLLSTKDSGVHHFTQDRVLLLVL